MLGQVSALAAPEHEHGFVPKHDGGVGEYVEPTVMQAAFVASSSLATQSTLAAPPALPRDGCDAGWAAC